MNRSYKSATNLEKGLGGRVGGRSGIFSCGIGAFL